MRFYLGFILGKGGGGRREEPGMISPQTVNKTFDRGHIKRKKEGKDPLARTYLWCLGLDLTRTSERTMNFSHLFSFLYRGGLFNLKKK